MVVHFVGVAAVEDAVQTGFFESVAKFGEIFGVVGVELVGFGIAEVGGAGGGELGEESGEGSAGGTEGGGADGAVVGGDGFDEFVGASVEAVKFGGGGDFWSFGGAASDEEDDEEEENTGEDADDDFHFFIEEAGGFWLLIDAGRDLI